MSINITKNNELEFYSLCLLAISLPIIEVTKNIACILLLVFFALRVYKNPSSFTHHAFGKYILIFLFGSIIAALGSYFKGYDTNKITDIIRYSLVGWLALHVHLNKKQLYILLWLLVTSTAIGIGAAYWSLSNGTEKYFELRSVGHINHTAIYIALVIGCSLPFLFKKGIGKKVCVLIFISIMLIALFKANSRAALLALAAILLLMIGASFINHKKLAFLMIATIGVGVLYINLYPPSIIKKLHKNPIVFSENKLTPREKLWNTAIHAWKKEPIFGIGYGNYNMINIEKMQEWYPEQKDLFSDQEQFLYRSHSHNRFLNTLVEGGLVGFLSLMALLFGVIRTLWSTKRHAIESNETLIFWLITANTLTISVVIGLFNTTIHHEHGLLSMLLLGLSIRCMMDMRHKGSQLCTR